MRGWRARQCSGSAIGSGGGPPIDVDVVDTTAGATGIVWSFTGPATLNGGSLAALVIIDDVTGLPDAPVGAGTQTAAATITVTYGGTAVITSGDAYEIHTQPAGITQAINLPQDGSCS